VKAPAIAVNPPAAKAPSRAPPKGRLDPALLHASHLRKPQLSFARKPNNFLEGPWRSSLKHKYHAQVPLGYIIDAEDDESPYDMCVSAKKQRGRYSVHLQDPPVPVRADEPSIPLAHV
jgi:exosome complex exonuclease RRP6